MVYFVGAGSGAVDLITVRGANLLGRADLVVYAGSLVNPELLGYAKAGAELRDSSGMTLEDIVDALCAADAAGKTVVRLHTGDPSLYGAIREQMDCLDAAGVAYQVVPGVSALAGAAAALKAEYTVPGVSQSVIITRVEGRTAVPAGERLRDLASHGCTMVLFLSSGLLDKVEAELLAGGMAPTTPAAIVYKATWPDELVLRCDVGTLARTAREAGISKTALVCVGDFLGDASERSRLYDPAFSHLFRAAADVGEGEVAAADAGEGARGGAIAASGGSGPVVPAYGGSSFMGGISFVAFTQRGCCLARRLADGLRALPAFRGARFSLYVPERIWAEAAIGEMAPRDAADGLPVEAFTRIDAWTASHFRADDALVFVGASGIAVRAIAPYVEDKLRDPAVVSIDEAGGFAIPLLSGHVGGANALARALAQVCAGQAAISTATDVNGAFAVDEWAARNGYALVERHLAKKVSAFLLQGKAVGLHLAEGIRLAGALPAGIVQGRAALGICVSPHVGEEPFPETLHAVPRTVTVGIGCRRGVEAPLLARAVEDALAEAGFTRYSVAAFASVDVKADEPALRELAAEYACGLRFYTAKELAAVPGDFAHSDFVERTVGVDNVCERAACAGGARLVAPKRVCGGVTVALAQVTAQGGWTVSFEHGGETVPRGQARGGGPVALAEQAAHGVSAISPEGGGVSPCARTEDRAVCADMREGGWLAVVGIGPGGGRDMTLRARDALRACDLVVGYPVYVDLVRGDFPDKEVFTTPMRKEVERCRAALEHAAAGRKVALVCSGDAGVYGMASLVLELAPAYGDVPVEVVPGVSAGNGGAAVLGAPIAHDHCLISLSDALTPWPQIERRLEAAACSGFAIVLYNPASRTRPGHLRRACEVLLRHLPGKTVCATVANIGRAGQESRILSLRELADAPADMFTTVFVGNGETRVVAGRMITPRGYRMEGR